ncbi:hypothetical protein E2C01_078534 [Portunus trituberculatus]|uniref:Uncharacterized protein n=1 Tax=Portunus trituberculatus TaxID=210409 RepID=A0A5B7IN41_PORTR|nr:hypothetical protein [Portunus trituberculatus]
MTANDMNGNSRCAVAWRCGQRVTPGWSRDGSVNVVLAVKGDRSGKWQTGGGRSLGGPSRSATEVLNLGRED